jgi:hypothetical protein
MLFGLFYEPETRMRLADYAQRLIELGKTFYSWLAAMHDLDRDRREKAALYAEEVASTLARAATALTRLEGDVADHLALLDATRELGRISGYVETIVEVLEHHLDGRKRAGVKRRLERLEPFDLEAALCDAAGFRRARKLASAEGFFRALADALRV